MGKQLLLISCSRADRPTAADAPASLLENVLELWPQSSRPAFLHTTFEGVMDDDSILSKAAVAWIIGSSDHLYSIIEMLQDRHVPVVLSRPSDNDNLCETFHDGVVIAPPQTDSQQLCNMLRTLWSQWGSMAALHTELKIAQAHQGGLCGQIETLDEELRLAAQLQREFLPRDLPEVNGISFRAMFRPTGYVSGDIYDAQRVDEDHIAFFIADAVGHGVSASLLTMYIKSAVQVKMVDHDVPGGYRVCQPDEVLSRLNQNMCRQQGYKVRFATACYGLLNCKTLNLSLARAGHPHPMLLRDDDTCELLDADGPLLGVFDDAAFEVTNISLRDGDRLLLYTDGFEVAFDENHKIAYTEQLKRMAHGTMDEAVETLVQTLDRQAGSLHQEDDLTCLLLGVDSPVLSNDANDDQIQNGIRQRAEAPIADKSKVA